MIARTPALHERHGTDAIRAEALIVDERSDLSPTQMVEAKLQAVLRRGLGTRAAESSQSPLSDLSQPAAFAPYQRFAPTLEPAVAPGEAVVGRTLRIAPVIPLEIAMRLQINFVQATTEITKPPETHASMAAAQARLREIYPEYHLSPFRFEHARPLHSVAQVFRNREEANGGGVPIATLSQSPSL